MHVLIFLPVYKRPEITKICYEGIKRIRHTLLESGVTSQVLVVASNQEDIDIIPMTYDRINVPNFPVSDKHSISLAYALKNYKFDYLLQMGSNNLLSDHYIRVWVAAAKSNIPAFGSRTFTCLNKELNYTTLFKTKHRTKLSGVGRGIRRDLLTDTFWKTDINKGLDASSRQTIEAQGFKQLAIHSGAFYGVLDIKSDVDLNPQGGFKSTFDPKKLGEAFPELKLLSDSFKS